MKKRILIIAIAAVGLLSTLFGALTPTTTARDLKIIEFNTMIGVPRPYTGATNAIRNVPGGGLPWVIHSAGGELNANGKWRLRLLDWF